MGQTLQQRPGVRKIENRLGQKSTRHACAIVRRPPAAPSAGHQAVQLQQRQSPHESLMALTQGPQFLGQDGEELALQEPRKSGEKTGYPIHGGRRVDRNFAHHKYCIASPPRRKHFLSILFVATANQGAPYQEFCKSLGFACLADSGLGFLPRSSARMNAPLAFWRTPGPRIGVKYRRAIAASDNATKDVMSAQTGILVRSGSWASWPSSETRAVGLNCRR